MSLEVSSYTHRFVSSSSSASLLTHGPSGRLPIELLSEIFLLCMDNKMDDDKIIRIPLLLSKICSRWRSAAINNPRLWSRLSVHLLDQRSSIHPALLDIWLRRSGACPLTIYVFWEDPPFADSHMILDMLMAHSERWKTMFFYLPYRAFGSFDKVRGRLGMLTSLTLGTGDDILPPPPHSAQLDIFQIAPRLRSIECVNFAPTVFIFPWAQLREIPRLSGNIFECLVVLSQARKLSKLSYMFVEGGPPAPTSIFAQPVLPISPGIPSHYPVVYHNRLTSLRIMTPPWKEYTDLSPFFPHIHLPYLETLTICNLISSFGDGFLQFLSGLHNLRTLHLRRTALPDEQLVEGLKYLPSLTHLIVLSSDIQIMNTMDSGGSAVDQTVTRYLLEALTRNYFSDDETEGMLLPRLKELELTVSPMVAREPDTFVDMLQSRLRADEHEVFGTYRKCPGDAMKICSADKGFARLEHVRIWPCVEFDDEFIMRLIELKDLGLEVVVESEVSQRVVTRL